MTFEEVMHELETLGSERIKKQYMANGAREPLFGVATGAMRPLFKKVKINQALAEQLYSCGNYDAMYFAGMIADPKAMTEADFDRWIKAAYFYMISDYIVAVTLAESPIAIQVAGKWTKSPDELCASAGWSCFEWLLGWKPDRAFDQGQLKEMLAMVEGTVHAQPERVRHSMNRFVVAVGVSFLPLHEEATKTAKAIGSVMVSAPKGQCALPTACDSIQKMKEKGRLGFKRRAVRC